MLHAVKEYIIHWLTAVNQHSLQAPFIYDFYQNTLNNDRIYEDYYAIEQLRSEFITSKAFIEVLNLGANSKVNNNVSRPIADIAKKGITSAKKSRLLARIISTFDCKNIVELGTSLGINTMYLAAKKDTQVVSFEGCPTLSELAKKSFERLDYQNISLLEGNIDTTLPSFLKATSNTIDFAFLDANHNMAPTLTYFNVLLSKAHQGSIFVFDDIHWSAEMSSAWAQIVADNRVSLSVDLFDLGIVFFNTSVEKTHYRLRL